MFFTVFSTSTSKYEESVIVALNSISRLSIFSGHCRQFCFLAGLMMYLTERVEEEHTTFTYTMHIISVV